MATPTVEVTVDLATIAGEAIEGVTVRARLDGNEVYEGIVVSKSVSAVTDANGVAVLDLFPNALDPVGLGTQGTTYRFTAAIDGGRSVNVRAVVPNEACRLENILVDAEPVTLSAAELALAQAQTAVTTAATSAAAAELDAAAAALSYSSAAASAATASTNATAAAASATSAASSAASAAHIYAGSYASDPTTRPDGSAIQTGDQYFNSSDSLTKRYNGATWVASDLNTADLAVSGGSALIGFIQSGTGAVARTAQGKQRDVIAPSDFGAVTAAATALSAIETNYPDGVGVQVPTGTFTMDDELVLAEDRMAIVGSGRHATMLQYNLAAAGPAITVNNPASGGYNQGRITDLAFKSNNSTAKTFLDLVNVANFEVARVATNSGLWPGNSIGVRVAGRQLVHIHGCELGCARPLVIRPNATWPALATDHFLIENNELLGSSASYDVIEVEDGACFANTTFRHNAVVGGRHGIYWNDTTSSAVSIALLIDELRTEQGMDSAAYSIYLASTATFLQSVKITNSYLDSERNGIYLRNAQSVIIDNVTHAGGVGTTALDITLVAGARLILRNFYVQTGATVTITNGRCVRKDVSTSNLRNEEWVYDDGTAAGIGEGLVESQAIHSGQTYTIAAGATQIIAPGAFQGFIEVLARTSSTGALYFCTTSSAGTPTKEVYDSDGFYGIAAGVDVYNVYISSGNYVLQNNTGSPATFNVIRRGCLS